MRTVAWASGGLCGKAKGKENHLTGRTYEQPGLGFFQRSRLEEEGIYLLSGIAKGEEELGKSV